MTGLKVKYLVLGSDHQITPSPRKKGISFSLAKIMEILTLPLHEKYCKMLKSTPPLNGKIVENSNPGLFKM